MIAALQFGDAYIPQLQDISMFLYEMLSCYTSSTMSFFKVICQPNASKSHANEQFLVFLKMEEKMFVVRFACVSCHRLDLSSY